MRRFHIGLLVMLAACQSVPTPVANPPGVAEQPLEQKAIGSPDTTDADTSSSPTELINPKKQKTVTVAVVSDLNSSYGSLEYTQDVHAGVSWLVERRPDLVISSGDMVAGQRANLDYLGMWGAFHSIVVRRAC